MNIYRLKISLLEPHYPINEFHRMVEVSGNITFYQLHDEIFKLFERHDEHLWQFFISRQKMDSFNKLLNECGEMVSTPDVIELEQEKEQSFHELNESLKAHERPPIHRTISTKHTADICLDDLNLGEKEYLYYHFDFGDDWLHRIRIEKITEHHEIFNEYQFNIIKTVGEIPPQYDLFDDPMLSDPNDVNMDLEVSILSAMMLIVAEPENPLRYDDLIQMGLIDEMIQRDLIKPYVHSAHRVRLTPVGESELARMIELLGI